MNKTQHKKGTLLLTKIDGLETVVYSLERVLNEQLKKSENEPNNYELKMQFDDSHIYCHRSIYIKIIRDQLKKANSELSEALSDFKKL